MEGEGGCFAAKMTPGLSMEIVDGCHFGADEKDIANAISGDHANSAIADGTSPMFLVKDSVVRTAMRSKRNAIAAGLSDCHDGANGEACGHCEICRDAEREAFTRVVLAGAELPHGDLPSRLRTAVMSVTGMAWVDAPWEGAMSDEEVNEVFEESKELGLCPEKGEES